MKLLSVLSSEYDSLKRLVVKVWNGASRTNTAEEAGPYGVDSRPPKGMVAVYAPTQRDGDEVILAYLNKDRLAEIGEMRIFSTDDSAVLKAYIWLKNDGEIHVGGNVKHMMRFEETEEGFNQLRTDLNDLTTKFNAHTHLYAPGPGSPTPTASPSVAGSASTASIADAKINDIKTR